MLFPHGAHASKLESARIVREIARLEFVEFWRELTRAVILFDERSPENILANEIREFVRKWRARPAFVPLNTAALRRARVACQKALRLRPRNGPEFANCGPPIGYDMAVIFGDTRSGLNRCAADGIPPTSRRSEVTPITDRLAPIESWPEFVCLCGPR